MAPKALAPTLVLAGASVGVVLIGLAIGTGSLLLTAVLVAPLLLAAVLALKLEQVILFLFVASAVLGGSMAYFGRVGQAQWLPAGVGLVLYVRLALELIRTPHAVRLRTSVVLATLFLVVAVVSTLWAASGLVQWLYGLRFYFALGAVFLALAWLPLTPDLIRRLWQFVMWVVLLQVPVVAYQYLVVAGSRAEVNAAGEAWDAVVGTMGGSQEGGGQSSALGFFVVSGFTVALALWKRGLIAAWQVVGLGACALTAIFLAEVKFMALLMPLAVVLVLRTRLLTRIRLLAVGTLVIVGIVAGMPLMYNKLHYERAGRAPLSTAEFYERFAGTVDPHLINRQTGEMSRFAQVLFWNDRHSLLEAPKEYLLGHGMASTNVSRLGAGDVARRYYPMQVGTNSGVLMLWEVGLVGLLVAMAGMVAGAWTSFRLSRSPGIEPYHRALLEAGAIVLVLSIPTLFYKQPALKSAAIQFLLFLSVGQAAFWQRRLAAGAGPRGRGGDASDAPRRRRG